MCMIEGLCVVLHEFALDLLRNTVIPLEKQKNFEWRMGCSCMKLADFVDVFRIDSYGNVSCLCSR